jgi:hypothetical protein
MNNTKYLIGIETLNENYNGWSIKIDQKNNRSTWGYHSRWTGNYDKTIETDGIIEGIIEDSYIITFKVPYLSKSEYDILRTNTYYVKYTNKRKKYQEEAKFIYSKQTTPVTFHLKSHSSNYINESTKSGILKSKSKFAHSSGIFLPRTQSRFTHLLINQTINKFNTYENNICMMPFGFHQKNIPLYDISIPINNDEIKDKYRSMYLTNVAMNLVGDKTKYNANEMEIERLKFKYDLPSEKVLE